MNENKFLLIIKSCGQCCPLCLMQILGDWTFLFPEVFFNAVTRMDFGHFFVSDLLSLQVPVALGIFVSSLGVGSTFSSFQYCEPHMNK